MTDSNKPDATPQDAAKPAWGKPRLEIIPMSEAMTSVNVIGATDGPANYS
jgi:hypothetical protein